MKRSLGALGFVVFCFVFIGCRGLPFVPSTTTEEITSTDVDKEGKVSSVGLREKDFVSVGMIFLNSSTAINSRGELVEGSEITFEMLMREAQKLGADDIVNLRIDKIKSATERRTTTAGGSAGRSTQTERLTITNYKATALAIKYVNAPAQR